MRNQVQINIPLYPDTAKHIVSGSPTVMDTGNVRVPGYCWAHLQSLQPVRPDQESEKSRKNVIIEKKS